MKGKQLSLSLATRARKKGGRPPSGDRPGVSHAARPEVSAKTPLHVTLTTVPEVGRLRTPTIRKTVQRALNCSVGWSRQRGRMRICHLSIQGNHIHLLVEAENKQALSRGMQGFKISCAKQINALLRDRDGRPRRGRVFADRYHVRALTSPLEVHRALRYVFNNFRHHGAAEARQRLDPYASGHLFRGWRDHDSPTLPLGGASHLLVWLPQTWLLSAGWQRHGPLDPWEAPGAAQNRTRASTPTVRLKTSSTM